MPWFKRRREENLVSIANPLAAGYFGVGDSYAGVSVGEVSTLGVSAVWRAVSLISGTIAQLPMRTVREGRDGRVERVRSIFDAPNGPDGQTRFEWVETMLIHLLLHGNAFLRHRYNGAGALYSLDPVHPLLVAIDLPRPGDTVQPVGGKWFTVTYEDGQRETLDATDMTHIPALTTDGVRGLSPITVARMSLGTAIAGDRAAAKMFSSGALVSGIVSPDEELEPDEVEKLRNALDASTGGHENAGRIAVVSQKLNFTKWAMTASDAQFLQSRQFSVEEVARWFGVPPHLLMQTEKQTSWGTGVAEQNEGLGRFTLAPWTKRIEERLSRLLPNPRYVEFDFAGLERPSFETEIRLLIEQVNAGLLTVDEARAIRNLPPVQQQPTPAQGGSA